MLGRFSHVLQNAVDAIAPPAPLHDDFVYHWRRLMKHYLVVSSNKVPVELTNIPGHLQQLQKILQKEDDENKGEKMGPCVEYLLQHNMLDLLATLAATDDPPGMKQHVLQFVTRLITQLRVPVLAHCSVFPSLQRLVKTCDGSQHMPTENDEVHFLFILSALLRKQPQLIYMLDTHVSLGSPLDRRSSVSSEASSQISVGSVFQSPLSLNGLDNQQQPLLESQALPSNNPLFRPCVLSSRTKEPKLVPVQSSKDNQSTSSFDDNSDVFEDVDSGRISETDEEKVANSEYIILDGLLSYIDSADSRVRVKACQGIMLLVSLPDNKLANCLLENSHLCLTVVSKLCSLYADIPSENDPNLIEELHVSWGLDVPISAEQSSSESYRAICAFFSWFDFCDQVIKEAEPGIASALAASIRIHFFQELFPVEDLTDVLALSLIAKCFKMTTAPALLKEMSYWAVGESREADLLQVVTCPIRQALIDCCCSENNAVSLEALRLFEVLLEKNSEHIIHCLVLTYVNGRTYFDSATSVTQIASWSDEEDERERCRDSPGQHSNSKNKASAVVTSRTFTPTHIEKIIHSFLNVVPSQLRSAPPTETSGYHQYVSESARQYSKVLNACKSFAWPVDAVSDENGSSDSKPEADAQKIFYEGPFLKMLFSRLRNLSNQAYEINLELTAVVSRLSLLPHPFLHEYLLNPILPRHAEADSLFAALNDVASKLLTEVTALPNYKDRLSNTRHHLLGDDSDEQDEMSGVLESVVVLEELCKELAAIAYVKFHNAL